MRERDGCRARRPADRLVRRIRPTDRARLRPDDGIHDDGALEQHDVTDLLDAAAITDLAIDIADRSRSDDRPRA
jgi:hypothetical protein